MGGGGGGIFHAYCINEFLLSVETSPDLLPSGSDLEYTVT